MNQNEFSDRTKKFLSEQEIARYDEDFEPAYMACDCIDKDDFCAILKDERVRKVVASFSKYILNTRANEKNAAKCFNDMVGQRDAAVFKACAFRKFVALIQSTCDRALAADGKSSCS